MAGMIDGRQVEQIIDSYYTEKKNKLAISIYTQLTKAASILAFLALLGVAGYHVKHRLKIKEIRSIIRV